MTEDEFRLLEEFGQPNDELRLRDLGRCPKATRIAATTMTARSAPYVKFAPVGVGQSCE